MKLVLCLALCAFAAALPSAEDPADVVVPENTEDTALIQASYDDAKSTIAALLQEGKDDSACRDLAQATRDEVTNSVEQQQKSLAALPNGSQCDDEGQDLIDDANAKKTAADKAASDAANALTAAQNEEFNFGDFKYTDLTEGQCNTFFSSAVWQNAKNKVNAAKNTYNTKQAEASAAAQNVESAKAEAERMVKKCKCDTKKTIESEREKMNANAQAANTKAWNKAYHMECVLDGKTTNNCNVPSLPTVQPVPFAAGVDRACATEKYDFEQYYGPTGDNPTWQCGNNNNHQRFQLGKIYVGEVTPTASDWKKCQERGDGWMALCDYNNACKGGWVQQNGIKAAWPDRCPNHWHNKQMPNQLRHPDGTGVTSFSQWNMDQADPRSLMYTAGVRNDGASYGHAATNPSSWLSSAQKNWLMCIKLEGNCAVGSCGFNGN